MAQVKVLKGNYVSIEGSEQAIRVICAINATRHYCIDADGLVGVLGREKVNWYRWTMASYSLCGQTSTAIVEKWRELPED